MNFQPFSRFLSGNIIRFHDKEIQTDIFKDKGMEITWDTCLDRDMDNQSESNRNSIIKRNIKWSIT